MPKWYHPDLLDFGLDRMRAQDVAGNDLELHLITAYAEADSEATVEGNSIGSVDLVGASDFTLANQGTNGRQVTIGAKTIASASGSSQQYETNTATSGGASTLTRTGAGWTVNEHDGRAIEITAGTGSGQTRNIASNTADTITVETAWSTEPDATSVYRIVDNLHVAVIDQTESKVLLVTDETSNQIVTAGNQVNVPAVVAKQNQPT